MATLLAGNGINIQFGGKAYSSHFIIERMKCRAIIDKYDVLFEGTMSGPELAKLFDGFVSLTNRIIEGECDDKLSDPDLISALVDFKKRYTPIEFPHDIMLEDWLFVLKMYSVLYNDEENMYKAEVGFKRLFLDAIYNDGLLQKVHENFDKKVKKYFKHFDQIFTVNYDTNLEKVTSSPVYHLHGSYDELQAAVNPDYVLGYQNSLSGKSVLMPGYEHCFCNALFSYSGALKYKEAKTMHKANLDISNAPLVEMIRNSNENMADFLAMHEEHPELKIAPEYYFDKFESISGELVIIGMSPNNDQHIIDLIKANGNITKITFYCYSDSEMDAVRNLGDNRFVPGDAKELWKGLGVEGSKRYGVKFPSAFEETFDALCVLSDYETTVDEVKTEICSIAPYHISTLCDECFADLKKHDAIHSKPKNEEFFKKNFIYISHIATKHGIKPPTMLALLILNWDKYSNS